MDLNSLSARIIKAEMLGDMERVAELKEQLEEARKSQESSAPHYQHRGGRHGRPHQNGPQNRPERMSSSDVSDLNGLNAKLLKAEMMGDEDRVAELRRQLNELRNKGSTVSSPAPSQSNYLEDLMEQRQRQEPLAKNPKCVQIAKKISDDRLSLKQMFVKAKRGEAEDEARLFIASSSKLLNVDDEYEGLPQKKKKKAEKEELEVVGDEDEDQECDWCISKVKKHLVVAIKQTVYLCLPAHEPFVTGHCYIRSRSHIRCTTQADENCLREISNLRARLCQLFEAQNLGCVFMEMFFKKGHGQHFQVECIPIKKKYLPDAKMYFRKAIQECEGEWAMNKKLVEMKDKCITKAIPRGLSYFWVSFGPTNDSYGHVIEEAKYFPKHFGHEVIAGLLDLDRYTYMKPRSESFDQQYDRVSKFKSLWRKFDTSEDEKIERETE